jgi:hypothetical protein
MGKQPACGQINFPLSGEVNVWWQPAIGPPRYLGSKAFDIRRRQS